MPVYVVAEIIRFLDIKTCRSLMQTCRKFYDEELWKTACALIFEKWVDHKKDNEKWSSFFLETKFSLGPPTFLLHEKDANCDIFYQTWYISNLKHRALDLPANIKTHIYSNRTNDVMILEEWFWRGKLHRQNGPAIVKRFKNIYKNAYINEELILQEFWYNDGELHREGGPAVTCKDDGIKMMWYRHGLCHRDKEEGPAVIRACTGLYYNQWWENGVKIE